MQRLSLAVVIAAALTCAAALLSGCNGSEDKNAAPTTTTTAAAATERRPAPPPAPPPAPAPTTLVFKKKTPPVGTKMLTKSSSETTVNMTLEGVGPKPRSITTTRIDRKEKIDEVLAIEGDLVTKVKVTYTVDASDHTADGRKVPAPKSPIQGKTYIVEAAKGKLTVTTEKGAPAPAAEATLVKQDHKELGQPDQLQAVFPEDAIKIGDTLDAFGAVLQQKLAVGTKRGAGAPKIEDVRVSLASISGAAPAQVGTFNVTFHLGMNEEPLDMGVAFRGHMIVRSADSWPTQMKIEGPIRVALDKNAPRSMKLTGGGSMSVRFDVSYE
jgi:hypothetical protein